MTRTVAQVEASFEGLSVAEEETDDLSVPLTSIRSAAAGLFEAEATRPKAELLNARSGGGR